MRDNVFKGPAQSAHRNLVSQRYANLCPTATGAHFVEETGPHLSIHDKVVNSFKGVIFVAKYHMHSNFNPMAECQPHVKKVVTVH